MILLVLMSASAAVSILIGYRIQLGRLGCPYRSKLARKLWSILEIDYTERNSALQRWFLVIAVALFIPAMIALLLA